MNNEEVRICARCGEIIPQEDEAIETTDGMVCGDCLENYYIWCEATDDYCREENAVRIYTDGRMRDWIYANEDADLDDYPYDYEVGAYFENSDCGYYLEDGNFICDDTYEQSYITCYDCDTIIPNDEARAYNGDYYCEECYSERAEARLIYNYHEFKNWQLFKSERENRDNIEPKWYIGFELEIDTNSDYNIEDVHKDITDRINSILMHDGSLSSRGIEIISHPQSYECVCEQETKYRELFDILTRQYNFTSHENGRCGLHFHVTRPSDEVIDRCELILENFKEELVKFSRRDDLHWCRFISELEQGKPMETKSIKYIKEVKNNFDRYMALNLTNRKTIEFRLMRGTLKYNTFRASLDLINKIMEIASDLEYDLTSLTWDDLCATQYIKDYCVERNIVSHKCLMDYTKAIEERDEKMEDYRKKLITLLKSYISYTIREYNTSAKLKDSADVKNKCLILGKISDALYYIDEYISCKGYDCYNEVKRMDYLKRYVNSKYYQARINAIVKEAEILCAL